MTDAKSRVGALKAAVVAFAALYAAAALTVLSSATVTEPRARTQPSAIFNDTDSLAR